MSEAQCKPGDNTGFPVTLAQSLYREWPATNDAQRQIQSLTVPTDFSIQWLNNGIQGNANISVRYTTSSGGVPGVFQISGFNPDGSTITFGNAQYKCSGIISIVQNQHPTFCQDNSAQYEMILAFQITNKSTNPSSPDIILLCRPIVFQSSGSNPPNSFWNAVDTATFRNSPQGASIDLSRFFGYNSYMLMPIVTYQTCMPVKLLKAGGASYASLRIRVNVVTQPIYVFASENGLGKCSSIRKYTLVTTGNGPLDIFASGHNLIQFKDGTGTDAFPNQNTKSNLVPNAAPNPISALADVLQKFEILVPEAFLGKSLAEISNSPAPPRAKPKKKAYKCYTIDPSKDIVDGEIMVDPTTGQSVKDTVNQEMRESGGREVKFTKIYKITGVIPELQDGSLSLTVSKTDTVQGGNFSPGSKYHAADIGDNVILVIGDINGRVDACLSFKPLKGKTASDTVLRPLQPGQGLEYLGTDIKYFPNGYRGTDIRIQEITVSSFANENDPGIMPGDVENVLTTTITFFGTVALLSYLGFIAYIFLHADAAYPLNTKIFHVVMFIISFVMLMLFLAYDEKTDN